MNKHAYENLATRLYPSAKLVSMTRLTGGVSANVHRLDLKLSNGHSTSVVLRAHGTSYSGRSADLEYRLLNALHHSNLPVPEALFVDSSCTLLNVPFLLIEHIKGTSEIPAGQENQYIDLMAETLAEIHTQPTSALPSLPIRSNPLPEVFDYLPKGRQWSNLRTQLAALVDTNYVEPLRLLHGDFWPENLLWKNGVVAAVLDWEDAAIGDPLSDVAGARVELRYKFGVAGMQRFTEAYARHHSVDLNRLALWQVYVAAAAHHFMGEWGLKPTRLAHMQREALLSIQEAGRVLAKNTDQFA